MYKNIWPIKWPMNIHKSLFYFFLNPLQSFTFLSIEMHKLKTDI